MKIVIDSSVLISALDKNDPYLKPSSEFLNVIHKEDVILPIIVVAETMIILLRQGYGTIPELLDNLFKFKIISLDKNELNKIIANCSSTTNLKTADFIITMTAKLNKAILVTWDRQLLKNSICKTLTPQEFIK